MLRTALQGMVLTVRPTAICARHRPCFPDYWHTFHLHPWWYISVHVYKCTSVSGENILVTKKKDTFWSHGWLPWKADTGCATVGSLLPVRSITSWAWKQTWSTRNREAMNLLVGRSKMRSQDCTTRITTDLVIKWKQIFSYFCCFFIAVSKAKCPWQPNVRHHQCGWLSCFHIDCWGWETLRSVLMTAVTSNPTTFRCEPSQWTTRVHTILLGASERMVGRCRSSRENKPWWQ